MHGRHWKLWEIHGFPQKTGLTFWRGFKDQRLLIDAAANAAYELFGEYKYDESKPSLYKVEMLTLKESVVATRMDITHSEKIELIKPLREARRAHMETFWEQRGPSKWETEYEENSKRRAIETEKYIVEAMAETMVITDEDRSWAASFGLSL